MPDLEEIKAKFLQHVRYEGECWIWKACSVWSIGRYRMLGKMWMSNAASVFLFGKTEAAESGHRLHNTCGNKLCVNPDHWEIRDPPTREEIFWSRVNKGDSQESCWMWEGKSFRGYGVFLRGKSSHVYSYELHKGPIPAGLQIDHLCRNTICGNPDHLEAVTPRENLRRRILNLKTHCPQGHEYTPENTYYPPGPGRQCKMCRCLLQRRLRAERKAKEEALR